MSATSSKGIEILLSKGSAAATEQEVTAVTLGASTTIEVPTGTITAGDILTFPIIGYSDLDGKTFIAGKVTTATKDMVVVLTGKDLTGGTGTLVAGVKVGIIAPATDMLKLCLGSITINTDTPSTISTATYCDPSASIPSAVVAAGTLDITGYVDIGGADYKELLLAVEDGKERILTIILPNNGQIVMPVKFSSMTWETPLDGAIGFSATASLSSKAIHSF